jgi:hypothetical protein
VHTLDEKGIEAGYFLTTDPKRKFGRTLVFTEETCTIRSCGAYIRSLNPDVTEEVTLRAQGDADFITRPECTDIVETFRLDGKVRVAFVVLVEKRNLGVASDEYILSTFRCF